MRALHPPAASGARARAGPPRRPPRTRIKPKKRLEFGILPANHPPLVLASCTPAHLEGGQVTKSEFIDQVADRAGLSKKDAADAVDAMLETIQDALRRGSDVVFSGFGKYSVSQRAAREGRNPATGEKIKIAASRVPKFTAGAGLKKAVN